MESINALIDVTSALENIYGKLLISDRDGEVRITEEDGDGAERAVLFASHIISRSKTSSDYYVKEISEIIQDIEIICPACEWLEGKERPCPECGALRGVGKINVLEFIDRNPVLFSERPVIKKFLISECVKTK